MDWKPPAEAMAAEIVHTRSQWLRPLEDVPRHVCVPSWWEQGGTRWVRVDGAADVERWYAKAYSNTTLITRIGPHHADDAEAGQDATGMFTSSSTLPSLLVKMYRHALLSPGMDVLDVGTGSGYGAGLLATRLGDAHVTSVDVDPYLVDAATQRLGEIGLHPKIVTADATEHVEGTYDRVIATVSLRPIPPALVAAVRPGGRLVAVISGLRAVLTADRIEDGRLLGRIEHDSAGFMNTRHGDDFPPGISEQSIAGLWHAEGQEVSSGLYPLANPDGHWELSSMLGITNPGVGMRWLVRERDGTAASLLWDADGSWARAEGIPGEIPTVVHQGGPQRLWTLLDGLKTQWLADGGFPLYGANAMVGLDGSVDLMYGNWRHKITS